MMRGIRGAITVNVNSRKQILSAAARLLVNMMKSNKVKPDDIASIIFSATYDLNAEFPARAARMIGLDKVPLFCVQEIKVPKSLKKCIRVLMHVNTKKNSEEIKHVYLEKAQLLRKEFNS